MGNPCYQWRQRPDTRRYPPTPTNGQQGKFREPLAQLRQRNRHACRLRLHYRRLLRGNGCRPARPSRTCGRMLQYWEEGYDDIYAKRRNRGEGWMRRRLSLAFWHLTKMSRIDILPNAGRLPPARPPLRTDIKTLAPTGTLYQKLFCWIGYRKKSINSTGATALPGHSSWSFFKLLNFGNRRNHLLFHRSLRIATVASILCSISSFIYAIYFLIKTIIYGDQAAGFPTW